jgi:competence transcription factor ComK
MDYVVNTAYGVSIYQENEVIQLPNQNNLNVIKKMCLDYLFDYEGYTRAIHEKFGFKYKIPVFMSSLQQWIPTKAVKCYDNIWINYANIKSFCASNKGCKITFFSHKVLEIPNTYEQMCNLRDKLYQIKNYKVKHFH